MDDTSIPFAICSDGKHIYASELTKVHREQYKALHIRCPECDAKLIVATKNEHFFFKHYSNESCLLESKKFTREYREYILQQSLESEKHKFLKNKLKEKLKLSNDPLIDKNSVCIEKYTDGRRADVYCERNAKKIAFEVQISPLSLSIILDRINHYREKNIHLFWLIEPSEFNKPQFQKDIKHYGLSEHIYELSSDDKLLKCHFKAPKIYYKNGYFLIEKECRYETVNLSDLQIVENQPVLLNYDNEEKQLKKIINIMREAAESLDKSRLQAIDNKLDQLKDKKPLSRENLDSIKKLLSWLKQYPNLLSSTVFQAARTIDFIPYIKNFHSKFIHWDIDDFDNTPYMYLDCPICPSLCEYNGRIEIKIDTGSCIFCDYKNIDLIQYIADMLYKGNKLKAAQEICYNHNIPYKSGI